MTAEDHIPVEERILRVMQCLGIEKAHFAASTPGDWLGLVEAHPEVVSSLTLVFPTAESSAHGTLGSRLLVFNGDRGSATESLQRAVGSVPDASLVALHDYQRSNFADVIADRSDSINSALMDFLGKMNQGHQANAIAFPECEGEAHGITYRVRGTGPPLILLPMEYAASQWESLLPMLSQHYSTIILGGAFLGIIMESRARSIGAYTDRRHYMVRLTGRVAVITGGAGGIGQAAARQFTAEGARVVLVALDEAALRSAVHSIGEDMASYVVADVTQRWKEVQLWPLS